jgi:hypothetical protein
MNYDLAVARCIRRARLSRLTICPAIKLQLKRFAENVKRLKSAWQRLPPEFRGQLAEHFHQIDHGGADWVWKVAEELELMPKE